MLCSPLPTSPRMGGFCPQIEVVVELGDAGRKGYAWNGWKREEGRGMMEDVRGMMEDGRRKMEEGRWKMSHRSHCVIGWC